MFDPSIDCRFGGVALAETGVQECVQCNQLCKCLILLLIVGLVELLWQKQEFKSVLSAIQLCKCLVLLLIVGSVELV